MKYKFKAEGRLLAYIEFKEDLSFKINDNANLFFYKSSSTEKKFIIEGACEVDVYEYINKTLNGFCYFLSLVFEAQVNQITISSSSIEDIDSSKTPVTKHLATRYHIQGKASILAPWKNENVEYLNNLIKKYSEVPLPIVLFSKALTEQSTYGQFWYFYNILQILIGDRVKIDKYLKLEYPKLKLLYSDYERHHVTLTIAIRDSFSHPTTYNGKLLDLNKEIVGHIYDLQKIIMYLLRKEYII